MSISALKIAQAPAAFAELAMKHNALVELVAQMAGAGGIEVFVTEGGIVIDGSGAGGGDYEARVAALESTSTTLTALTSGLSRTSVSYCSGGSTTTKTILMS